MAQPSLLSPSPQQADGETRESLSAHILALIAEHCGPQLPCYQSDSILNGFLGRFSADDVMAICQQAFSVRNGMWRGAPVTLLRFQENQDGYFAHPLLQEARAGN